MDVKKMWTRAGARALLESSNYNSFLLNIVRWFENCKKAH